MQPLNHREWLEGIARTGAQRSGFAADALAALDVYEGCDELLDGTTVKAITRDLNRLEAIDAFCEQQDARAFSDSDDTLANLTAGISSLREDAVAYGDVLCLLDEVGLIDLRDGQPDDVCSLLRMFLPC